MSEIADVIVIDDDELEEFEDFRNARGRRPSIVRGPSSGRRRPTAIVRGERTGGTGVRPWTSSRRPNAGPVLRADTGGLSYGVLIDAAAQVLAAIQSLPTPPSATGCANTDVGNLMVYQRALAEHAKRDEQLRTLGSLASKFLA